MRTKLELLRAKDVAPMLGVGTRRVLQLVQEGRLPAVRTGRAVRFPRLAVETCFKQWTEQALEDMARTPPPVEADQPLASAIHVLAGASPFGWTGTSTELLDRLDRGQEGEPGGLDRWPKNGRSLGVALRRLLGDLRRNHVLVQLGHRGHRGRRLISIRAVDPHQAGTGPSAASRRLGEKRAPVAGRGSPRTRGAGGDAFTGVIEVDAELFAECERSASAGSESPGGSGPEVRGDD